MTRQGRVRMGCAARAAPAGGWSWRRLLEHRRGGVGRSNVPAHLRPSPPSRRRRVTTQPCAPRARRSRWSASAAPTFAGPRLIDVVCEDRATPPPRWPPAPTASRWCSSRSRTAPGSSWANGPVDGDRRGVAPEGFSATAIPAWQRLRDRRLTEPRRGPGGGVDSHRHAAVLAPRRNPNDGALEVCTDLRSRLRRVHAGHLRTPARRPGGPERARGPAGHSNFCQYNYNDPARAWPIPASSP